MQTTIDLKKITGIYLEKATKKSHGFEEKTQCCYNCRHYFQHYVIAPYMRSDAVLVECDAGHCTFPRLKIRKPADACGYFERGKPHARESEESPAGGRADTGSDGREAGD